jgi:putative salt-induced outer membrane protein
MKRSLLLSALVFSFPFISKAVVTNESELGVIIAKGNSDSQSYNAKELLKEKWDENSLQFTGRFLKTKTSGIENARYWSTGLRYDRELSHRLGVFLGELLESDKYAGYNQKYNTDLGAKYAIMKEAKFLWDAELGYRYTVENDFIGDQKKLHYMRAYTEATKEWTEGVSTKLWFEYLPNFTIGSDYQMNSEISVTAALTNIFSVKSGYLLRYDNLPNPGAHAKTDTLFTTALVAKF